MNKLDSVDLETIEMLKESYNENNTNEKKEEEPKNKTNPNITTEHLIEMARNGLTLYYQKNHPNFPMYGYLIDMFCFLIQVKRISVNTGYQNSLILFDIIF